MSLNKRRAINGLCSISPYNPDTREYYGTTKILASSNFSLAGETVELTGGCSPYPYAVGTGLITSELAIACKEYPDWAFEVLLGKALTENAAETGGSVTTAVNNLGASVIDGSNGIGVSITVADEADLRFGKYTIIAVTADTFNVFLSTDINIGTLSYVDESLKINDTPLDVSTISAVLADYGLTFDLNGTAAFTIGDTASFAVRNINTGSYEAVFGGTSDVFPDFGAVIMGANQDGNLFELDIFRMKAIGMPINFAANEFSEWEVTAKAFYDTARGGVFSMREIK